MASKKTKKGDSDLVFCRRNCTWVIGKKSYGYGDSVPTSGLESKATLTTAEETHEDAVKRLIANKDVCERSRLK